MGVNVAPKFVLAMAAGPHYAVRIRHGDDQMPKMSDNRRKKIQMRQRKLKNATSRAAKIAKKKRNAG